MMCKRDRAANIAALLFDHGWSEVLPGERGWRVFAHPSDSGERVYLSPAGKLKRGRALRRAWPVSADTCRRLAERGSELLAAERAA